MSDVQGDLTIDLETVTHTSNEMFEQNYWVTGPSLPPPTNTGIDQGIELNILAPQILPKNAKKEVDTNATSIGAWVHRTSGQVISTGVYGITPGDIHDAIGIVELSSPVIIVIVGTYPPCVLNVSQGVGNKL